MKNKFFALFLISALVVPSFAFGQAFDLGSSPVSGKQAAPLNQPGTTAELTQQPKLITPAPANLHQEDLQPEPQFLSPQGGAKLSGSVSIQVQVQGAENVEFYLRKAGSLMPIYLGDGTLLANNKWSFSWDTNLTPNGHYGLFAKVKNQYGTYQSKENPIEVANVLPSEKAKKEAVIQSIQKVQKEAQSYQKQIQEQNKKAEDMVLDETKSLVDNTLKQIPDNQKVKIQPVIQKNLKQALPQISSELKLAQEKTQTEATLENSLKQKEKEKLLHAQEITQEKKTLAALSKKATGIAGTLEIAKDVAVQDHLAKINKHEETQKEIAQSISSLQKQLAKIRQEKQAIIKNIQNNVVAPVQPAVKIVQNNPRQQAAIQKNITEAQKTVAKNVENFTKATKTKEVSALQVLAKLKKDSDGDGIPDVEELKIGTDPLNPDTDGDGYLDGVEVKLGYNPLSPSPAAKIVYQQPTKSNASITGAYKVTRVSLVTPPTTPAHPNPSKYLKIEGKGLPLSFVTIYLYSSPLVLVTKTDANGNFSYVVKRPLAEGYHRVYVAVTDNTGKIVERSSAFQFLKTPTAIAAVMPPVSGLASATASPAETLNRTYTLLILSVIVLALAVALSIIGFLAAKKNKNLS